MKIALDIETIPLPPEKREFTKPDPETFNYGAAKKEETRQAKFAEAVAEWERGDKAALKAITGSVALIMYTDGKDMQVFSTVDGTEADMLDAFWLSLEENRPSTIIGHNLINFDIKFLVRRSIILGVDVPERYIAPLFDKYRQELYVDTMQFWGLGEYNYMVSLAKLCAVFGIDVKESEVNGKEFYRYWVGGDREDVPAALDYCRQDVEATWKLAKKLRI